MSVRLQRLDRAAVPEIATTLRNAGIAGAGGAGFPTHAKWERLEDVPYLLMNHQESEPNYYMDKWLGRERAETFAAFFDALLGDTFEVIVIGAKITDREEWMGPLESATDATIYTPEDLPLDPEEESGVVVAYTEDRYQYGMENVLLRLVGDVVLQDELPMDHGWLVQNTETLFDIYRALTEGEPVTRKFVHVDGNVPEHRFLDAPIGTPANTLLEAAGRSDPPSEDERLADGGPGWCFEIERSADKFGVNKRTNCLLVLDEDVVEGNTLGDGRIDVRSAIDWKAGDHETTPETVRPATARIPLLTNPDFGDIVARSRPIVEAGTDVSAGEMIAVPGEDGVSNAHHASIEGTVAAVHDRSVEIDGAESEPSIPAVSGGDDRMVYWTWCVDCGRYVARPDPEHLGEGTEYLCPDCR